jgi:hypothetical protein
MAPPQLVRDRRPHDSFWWLSAGLILAVPILADSDRLISRLPPLPSTTGEGTERLTSPHRDGSGAGEEGVSRDGDRLHATTLVRTVSPRIGRMRTKRPVTSIRMRPPSCRQLTRM